MSARERRKSEKDKPKNPLVFIIGAIVLFAVCAPNVYYAIILNNYGSTRIPAGYTHWPKYSELYKTLFATVFMQTIRQFAHWSLRPLGMWLSKEQEDKETQAKYCSKIIDNIYGVSYFIFSSYWGWLVLKDSEFLPWYLGGNHHNGSLKNLDLTTVFIPYGPEMLEYSYYTFGYHLGNLIQHLFIDEKMNDFNEMLLHHVATLSLYFSFIFGNFIPFGVLINYLHDVSDILGTMTKGLSCTVHQNACAVAFFSCIALWFYTRLLCLPEIIYYIFTELEYHGDPEIAQF